jgi:hypothetical protein
MPSAERCSPSAAKSAEMRPPTSHDHASSSAEWRQRVFLAPQHLAAQRAEDEAQGGRGEVDANDDRV